MDGAPTDLRKENVALQQLVESLTGRLHGQSERLALSEARCRALEVQMAANARADSGAEHGHEHAEKPAACTFVGGLRCIRPEDVREDSPHQAVRQLYGLVSSLQAGIGLFHDCSRLLVDATDRAQTAEAALARLTSAR